jgi:dTDP-4-dehydrorhamnose reductase
MIETKSKTIKNMNILVLGANGFVGRRLLTRITQGQAHNVLACSQRQDINPQPGYRFLVLDITETAKLTQCLDEFNPNIIINAAAHSAVDFCQMNTAIADALNVHAVRAIAEWCALHGARFIHLSTDFVFDGLKGSAYTENDTPNPINYYGITKYEAEKIITQTLTNYAIIRIEVVYGKPLAGQHSNIVQMVKQHLEQGKPFKVITDQWRTPTWVEDVVGAIQTLFSDAHSGIYHIAGGERMSIAELAHRVAKYFDLAPDLLQDVTTMALNEKTPRPTCTPLDCSKAAQTLGYTATPFEESLKEFQ